MHKLIILLALFLSAIPNLQAQNQENRLLIEEYIQQSEKQKKTGLIMMGVGAAAAGLGTALAFSSDDLSGFDFGSGFVLFIAGSASTILGIPVLISSSSNARKAGKLSLGTQTVRIPLPDQDLSSKIFPTLTFSFPLNSSNK